ncbi:MAG: DNA translocase FtsK 4TM domain-containing protein [Phycisphaerales bacterium]|nr:DNA translocase FtsK 4TM domain-containing protein [Phycisphaerales bacterium]MCB9835206.1 DNA translocase FtsK 4TM domain-containing protein [Phycisphaera sp.]
MGTTTKKAGTSKSKARQDEFEDLFPLWRAAPVLGAIVLMFVAASLLSYDAADAPSHSVWPTNDPAQNWCGSVGAWVAWAGYRTLGLAIWPVFFGMVGLVVVCLRGYVVTHPLMRAAGVVIAGAGLAGMQGYLLPRTGPIPGLPGGTVGLVMSHELALRFGGLGTVLCLVMTMALGLVVAMDRWLLATPVYFMAQMGYVAEKGTLAGDLIRRVLGGAYERVRVPAPARVDDLDDIEEQEFTEAERKKMLAARKKKEKAVKVVEVDDDEIETVTTLDEDEEAELEYEEDDEYEDEEEVDEHDEEEEYDDDDEIPGAPQVFSEDSIREKVAKLPLRFAGANRQSATEDDLRDLQNVGELEGYQFPGLDLLEEPDNNFTGTLESLVREQAEALEAALQEFRIAGEVVGIESGPVITLYDVRLAPGTKVSRLTSISSDLARSLKAVNIRIVANQAGRDTVGIEVPNPTMEKVRLRELMSRREQFQKMKLPMFLGKDSAGDPLIEDLTKMPHMLIAGTTGSGKSVCMNTIIMSFLYTKKPNELKLVLVDPKMVEMSQFKDIPHLMCPVVTEMNRAAAILEWAVKKMDERYELLAEAGCRDISAYNGLEFEELCERLGAQTEEQQARVPRQMPYMVFIIDELADLMMTNKEVEGSIIRIAQKARAVGIHLILATQRPQANVVTGLIKSNMPCRIAFKVASGMDSRIVLDQKGGELLLGMGDMLFLSPRSHKLHRAQGTLVEDAEIRHVVKFMRDIAGPTYERQLMQLRSGDPDEQRLEQSENNSSASLEAAQEDPLFDRAVEIVLETKRGSVSLLQRRLAIGYTRASRLIDLMGIAGIIGEHKGSVAREVVISLEEWEAMKAYNEQQMRKADGDDRSDDEYAMDQEKAKANFQAVQGTTATASRIKQAEVEEEEEAPFETDEAEDEDELEEDEYEDNDESDEEEDEYEEVDEDEEAEDDDEYEYVLVDEEGNEIDPEDADEYEVEDETEEEEEDEEDEPRPRHARAG